MSSSFETFLPTPLVDAPRLAAALGLGAILIKDETARPLGNFKATGGIAATRRAIVAHREIKGADPWVVAASAGNHGLAVAAAALLEGINATIVLPRSADRRRSGRLAMLGARVVQVDGDYEDAVAAALELSLGGGILVADTSLDPNDETSRSVIAGYGVIARELSNQLSRREGGASHLFVQAGVGGLAAGLVEVLSPSMERGLVVVEPQGAASVHAALLAGKPTRVPSADETGATMLGCAMMSAPAFEILRQYTPTTIQVSEARLSHAVEMLRLENFETTTSGAASLAGLVHATCSSSLRERYALSKTSSVVIIVTEGSLNSDKSIVDFLHSAAAGARPR